ncbi:MAG: alpha/beta fold hydrolase [Flavobacteriales bacterium]|jgi:esterase|nr:alpha/beta fold hydrolase [Flavobacteriales bacterium]
MELFYKKSGQGQPLIVLHGLMGMLDNWATPAKVLSNHFEVYLVDQRNHGHSEHSDDISYQDMSDDLYEFIEAHQLEGTHVLGHSMGGKTAMKFAQNYPSMLNKLVIADIAPRAYEVHHHEILTGLKAIDLAKIQKRSEADKVLQHYIPEIGVRQFLLKNLYWPEKGRLAWRFNLNVISENIEQIGEAINDQQYVGETLFVRGERSNYIQDSDKEIIDIYFPNAIIETIANSGHWLHAEQPDQFLSCILDFLE